MFLEGIYVKPKVFEAVERALFILLFDVIISHIIPTISNPGTPIAITFSMISLYKRIAIDVCSLLS